jgi:hypothetical protein
MKGSQAKILKPWMIWLLIASAVAGALAAIFFPALKNFSLSR